MFYISVTIRAEITEGVIEAVCIILHNKGKKVTRKNVIKELKSNILERGIYGLEYIYDRVAHYPIYKGLEDDVKTICNEFNV